MAKKFLNGIDLTGQKLVGVGDPSAATDGVNLQTMQNFVRGLSFKDAVRAASTANLTLATPGASIDGVAMAANDRFLAKDQTTASQNGIYIWNGAAAAATRAADADTGSELKPGVTVFVTEGTVNADKQFVITSDAAITIGTTAMTWTVFGGGTTYTAGNGISLASNTITAVAAGSGGISVAAGGISVDTTIVARKFSAAIGTGALTAIAVTHNLGTKDVECEIREVSTDTAVETDWVSTDTNNVTFTFAVAPTTGQYRVTIIG
jgi:hypothetical protein